MNRITILKTLNGVLVLSGEVDNYEYPSTTAARVYSFSSVEQAVKQIRKMLSDNQKKKS